MSNPIQFIGSKLKKIREDRGVVLIDIEAATGIANSYLSSLETGAKENPSFKMVNKIAEYFKINALYFYVEKFPSSCDICDVHKKQVNELLKTLTNKQLLDELQNRIIKESDEKDREDIWTGEITE